MLISGIICLIVGIFCLIWFFYNVSEKYAMIGITLISTGVVFVGIHFGNVDKTNSMLWAAGATLVAVFTTFSLSVFCVDYIIEKNSKSEED